MKKKAAAAILCVAMSVVMAGCGGGNSASSNASESTTTVTGSKGDEYVVDKEAKTVETDSSKSDYEPYTITLNLERSGIGQNMEETFTSAPEKVIADGDQMADFFFDLGLEDHMAGFTRGACWSTVNEYPARDTVTDHFSVDFCLQNGIIPYFPYCCSDSATFDDIYKDYEVLGNVFGVQDLAAERVQTMKDTLASVEETLGEEVYADPIRVFVYDSGEEAPFTACQGVPGDMIKKAGGISIFDDIDKGWATPSWEEVVERDPDVILILDYDYDTEEKTEFLKTNDFTKNLRAVKEGRIYSACCSDMQGSAGSAKAVEIMARQFYPEKFEK